ncbi:MAG: NYN domain-containing protein [Spirochaetales bacterium]|nr:NYN domain-containing protein [Spirochaetales bacterium]
MEDLLKFEVNTAILVDGGFYRKRAYYLWKDKSPKERADELYNYCIGLLRNNVEHRRLYRIFYYDCPPISKKVYHPLLDKTVDLSKTEEYQWTMSFFDELRSKRKMALRLGKLSENTAHYDLKDDSLKKLMKGTLNINDLKESDFRFTVEQKGVDMRIGVDIITMALKKQVQQIILVSGDSDFVPASKQARREGIDMILAPMGATIKSDLYEHIDGLINIQNSP